MSEQKFNSRRSTVYSTRGVVSSTQPLANAAGIKILEKGGNAIDAAVAMSAALCVTETASTDLGGDAFVLFYDNSEKKVLGLNGCGRSAYQIDLELVQKKFAHHIEHNRLRNDSVLTVNVPGAIAAWFDAVQLWGSGKVSFAEILQPAIDLADNGYPISKISASMYKESEENLRKANKIKGEKFLQEQLSTFLPNHGLKAPREGQFMQNKRLAETLRLIAKNGKDAFYEGPIAESIIKEVEQRGGLLDLRDLATHTSTQVFPINYELLGKKLWEIPPNGSGIIALLALGIIKSLDAQGEIKLSELKHNSVEYLHLVIEALKLAFKDSEEYVHDTHHSSNHFKVDSFSLQEQLLTSPYFDERSKFFKKERALGNNELSTDSVPNEAFKSDTVYFSASDKEGNAASFINSVFHNFGSGILVEDRGFFLQNRGANFSLQPGSRNVIAGSKRPYHTIIPGMITTPQHDGTEDLYATFGIQGGFNQPQAHVQVYLNMLLFGLDPQDALDAPRISLSPSPAHKRTDHGHGAQGPVSTSVTLVNIEEGIDPKVVKELQDLGHEVKVLSGDARRLFGRGQIIRKEEGEHLIYSAGSDPRGDGAATAFF
jgi:gamma-glutamyltranspeptidase/glutathione hydrolase